MACAAVTEAVDARSRSTVAVFIAATLSRATPESWTQGCWIQCKKPKGHLRRPFGLWNEEVLLLGMGEALVDFVPVDDVPPGVEVVRAAVVVLEVIGVLPDVVAEDGVEAVG